MADTLTSSDFVPQTVTPPEKPLPLVRGLLQMIANPLYVWPQAMYENPYHGVKWIGRTFHYIRKPEHMKAVFLDHADIFAKSQFQKKLVGPALGDGLLTAEGEHWKFQRRAASPAFRIDRVARPCARVLLLGAGNHRAHQGDARRPAGRCDAGDAARHTRRDRGNHPRRRRS
jgi:cytochrome P450